MDTSVVCRVMSCPFLYQTKTIRTKLCPSWSLTQLIPHQRSTQCRRQRHTISAAKQEVQNPRPVHATRSPATTITSQERRVFEKIRQHFGGDVSKIIRPSPLAGPIERVETEVGTANTPTKSLELTPHDLNIENILSLFAPSSECETSSSDPEAESSSHNVLSPVEIRSMAYESLEALKQSFTIALRSTHKSPDRALWEVLETEVFPLIALLGPVKQRKSTDSDPNLYDLRLEDAITMNQMRLPSALTKANPRTPVLPLVTILYPAAILLAMRLYAAYRPASPYATTLLSKLKSLGPTSYILSGTTHFYNCLIQLKWEVYTDLYGILKLLKNMTQDGVELNRTTIELLQWISGQVDSRHGQEWLGTSYYRHAARELRELRKELIDEQQARGSYTKSETAIEVD